MNKTRYLLVLIPALLASCGQGASSSSSLSSSEATSEEASSSLPAEKDYMVKTIERKTLPFYSCQAAEPYQGVEVNVYSINGNTTVPYFEVEEGLLFANRLGAFSCYDDIERNATSSTLLHDNGDGITFDAEKNAIIYSDFQAANLMESSPANLVEANKLGTTCHFYAYDNPLYFRGGVESYELDRYGLKLYCDGEQNVYVPGDLLLEMLLGYSYQGACIDSRGVWLSTSANFKNSDGTLNEAGQLFYGSAKLGISQEEANYNYSILCLDMDMQYGLGASHGMDEGFNVWAENAGLREGLTSTRPQEFDVALAKATLQYLDDVHTKYGHTGYYSGDFDTGVALGPSRQAVFDAEDEVKAYRKEYIADFQPYMEIGDTAYVTFDAFTSSFNQYDDGYEAKNTMDDTITLINYANTQIRREGSPVKNVVLDLSANGGGAVGCGVFVLGWMLGKTQLSIRDPISGSHSRIDYYADANLDGVYDDSDNISDLNLYCLASRGSFSCGNLVPSLLKASDKVTLLGQTSGGGSCAVIMRATPSGSAYRISGRTEFCTYKNGTYYSVEQGATPDYYLERSQLCQREKLNAFIKTLQER